MFHRNIRGNFSLALFYYQAVVVYAFVRMVDADFQHIENLVILGDFEKEKQNIFQNF